MIPLFKVMMDTRAAALGLESVLSSGHVAEGPVVERFETELQRELGLPVLALNSCTSALHLALHLAIGQSDRREIITTPMTCLATNIAIAHLGRMPVWADVDPVTGLIDPEDVARKLTCETDAIIVNDWGGQPVDVQWLRRVVKERVASMLDITGDWSPPIIEDAAHHFYAAHGRETGDFVCYSFQAIKHLTTGDGGALHVPPHMRERARKLRWFGMDRKVGGFRAGQDVAEAGFKFHMNDIAAAIGLANLPNVGVAIARAREHASYYMRTLSGHPEIALPVLHPPLSSCWLFTLLTDNRDGFIAYMRERGIEASRVHRRNDQLTCFQMAKPQELPGTTFFDDHQVSIPVGWWLTAEELRHIAEAVIGWKP